MSTNNRIVFGDDTYDPQHARTLTAINAGMADLGEAMATAHQIGRHPAPLTWYDVPFHVLRGDTAAGSVVTTDHLDRLRANIELTSTHIPGAGHTISPWMPRTVRDGLLSFLRRIA